MAVPGCLRGCKDGNTVVEICGHIDEAVTNKHHPIFHPGLAKQLATKPFFKIGEVAKLVGVKPHVLRYWESEFPSLRPKKNPSGQRIYARADIEAIVEIQNLLYNERYTISGAKQLLVRQQSATPAHPVEISGGPLPQVLARLKAHVHELLALIERTPIS